MIKGSTLDIICLKKVNLVGTLYQIYFFVFRISYMLWSYANTYETYTDNSLSTSISKEAISFEDFKSFI